MGVERLDPDTARIITEVADRFADKYAARRSLRQPDAAPPKQPRRTEYTRYLERSWRNLRAIELQQERDAASRRR